MEKEKWMSTAAPFAPSSTASTFQALNQIMIIHQPCEFENSRIGLRHFG